MNDKNKNYFFNKTLAFGRVSLTQKAIFAKHLAVMLKSGLSITEALSVARDSAEGRLKKTLGKILKAVESGHPLADALAEYPEIFSGFFIHSIYAAEASGTLAESLENLAEQLKKEKELVGKIRGAMIYPLIVLLAAVILGAVLSIVVLPKITPLFESLRVDLPGSTKMLIKFSRFMSARGSVVMVGIAVSFVVGAWLWRRVFLQPFIHKLIMSLPISGKISRNLNLTRFCRTLGLLLKNGIAIDSALNITAETMPNYYYRKAIGNITDGVRRGVKLSISLEKRDDLFPRLLTRMVKVGEESGRYEETLFYLADFYENEVDSSVKSLSATIEPVLFLIMGAAVAFMAIAIITPIYDITGRLGR